MTLHTTELDGRVIALDPTGRWMCVAQLDSLQLFAMSNPLLPTALTPTGVVRCACFDVNGQYLLTSGDDKVVRAWDVATHTAIGTWTNSKRVGCVAFAPARAAGEAVGVWSDKFGEVFAVNLRQPGAAPVLKLGHLSPVSHLIFTPCGQRLLTSDREGHVRASGWPLTDVIERYYLTHVTPLQVVLPLASLPLLLTATVNGLEVCLWERDSGRRLFLEDSRQLRSAMMGAAGGVGQGPACSAGDAAGASAEGAGEIVARLRCACECAAQRLIALAFSGDDGVYFAAIGGGAGGGGAGPLHPRPELCLRLGSPALTLSCSMGERPVLVILTGAEILCFGPAAPGFGAQPVAQLLLSALPAPSAAAAAAEGAGGAEEEAGGGDEEEEEEA